jgi:hypothetical protein
MKVSADAVANVIIATGVAFVVAMMGGPKWAIYSVWALTYTIHMAADRIVNQVGGKSHG